MVQECPESNNFWKKMIIALKGIINNEIPLTLELCILVCGTYRDIYRSIGKHLDPDLMAVTRYMVAG